jgi:hypothetical protein
MYYGYINKHRLESLSTRALKFLESPDKDISFVEYDHSLETERNRAIPYTVHETIERNIFQAYIGQGNRIPQEIQDNIDFLKKNNPKWKYYLITDSNLRNWFKKINNKKYEKLYNELSDDYPAAKVDLLRYLLMKHFGGVYMDIKSTSHRPLDIVISDGTVPGKILVFKWCAFVSPLLRICHWRRGERKYSDEIVQWLLIYPKEHYFMDEVLNNIYIKSEIYKNDKNIKQDIYDFTGPDMFTDSIVSLFTEYNHTLCDFYGDLGFEYNFLKFDHTKFLYKKNHYLKKMEDGVKIIN